MGKNGELSLGIDLGGSKIYAVVADDKNNILSRAKIPTPHDGDSRKLASSLLETGKAALEELSLTLDNVAHIGIAVPSPVDPESGDCHFATNLAVKKFSMKSLFRELTEKEIFLANDGNCGLLAEVECGSAVNYKNVVGYFIGTGLGGALYLNGKLIVGNCGLAGELGHMIIRKGGRLCGCGHKGCVEAYCSKKAYVKAIHKYMKKYDEAT